MEGEEGYVVMRRKDKKTKKNIKTQKNKKKMFFLSFILSPVYRLTIYTRSIARDTVVYLYPLLNLKIKNKSKLKGVLKKWLARFVPPKKFDLVSRL